MRVLVLLLPVLTFALKHKEVVGPGPSYTLEWGVNAASAKELDVCVSASSVNVTETSWIGFGFAAVAHTQMLDADIVLGYPKPDGGAVITSYFSNQSAGFPHGPGPLVALTKTSVTFTASTKTIRMCFTRPFASGHNHLDATASKPEPIIWAIGPLGPAGTPTYHGVDLSPPQYHRSDEANEILWAAP